MKAFVKFLTICLLVSFIAGCGGGTPTATQPPATQPPATQPPATEPPLTAAEAWAEANEVGPYQTATQDWAAIEAAAVQEGKVAVYSNSSRIETEIELFQAKYPGITLEGYDMDDIATKMEEEQKAGNVVGDVWFNSDGYILFGTFVPNQWLWSFVPDTVVIPELTAEQPFAVARHGVDVVGYNTELNPNGCPVTNWWQMTEPAYKGRVFMEDPISNVSTIAIVATVTQHGDELATAYQALYGKAWNTDTAFGTDTPDAGWLWIKKFAQNAPGIQPGGDETVQAYATPGMTADAGIGLNPYSKYRDTLKGKLVFAPCMGIEPVLGFFKTTYLGIATNASHPNAAKLFIRFVLSDEGRAPWNVIGDYPAVEGQAVAEGAIPRAELKVWLEDDAFLFENVSIVRDFWALNLLAP